MLTYNELPANLKEMIDKPLNEKQLTGYALRVTDCMEHSRGVSWVGVVTYNGQIITTVENTGVGGDNDYKPKNKSQYNKLVALAKTSYPDDSESLDVLIGYLDIISNS